MLVVLNNKEYFAQKKGTQFKLYELNIIRKYDIRCIDIKLKLSSVQQKTTAIHVDSTDDEVVKFILNYGPYFATKYDTIKQDNNVYLSDRHYLDIISWKHWLRSNNMEWHESTDELNYVNEEGFLGNEQPEDLLPIFKKAYIRGVLHRRIGEVETKLRRTERKQWKKWIKQRN